MADAAAPQAGGAPDTGAAESPREESQQLKGPAQQRPGSKQPAKTGPKVVPIGGGTFGQPAPDPIEDLVKSLRGDIESGAEDGAADEAPPDGLGQKAHERFQKLTSERKAAAAEAEHYRQQVAQYDAAYRQSVAESEALKRSHYQMRERYAALDARVRAMQEQRQTGEPEDDVAKFRRGLLDETNKSLLNHPEFKAMRQQFQKMEDERKQETQMRERRANAERYGAQADQAFGEVAKAIGINVEGMDAQDRRHHANRILALAVELGPQQGGIRGAAKVYEQQLRRLALSILDSRRQKKDGQSTTAPPASGGRSTGIALANGGKTPTKQQAKAQGFKDPLAAMIAADGFKPM